MLPPHFISFFRHNFSFKLLLFWCDFRHKYPGMDRHYSTLELVKHDETARAPERDYDATAFELDVDALAPQISKHDMINCERLC